MPDISPVLSIIQEKLNNPSADDPFEPEIAAVSLHILHRLFATLIIVP